MVVPLARERWVRLLLAAKPWIRAWPANVAGGGARSHSAAAEGRMTTLAC